jgi:hypothetical protein
MPPATFARGTIPPPGEPLPSTGLVLDHKLVVGDITISYPQGLEAQAEELMAVCQQVMPPRRARYLVAARAFSDEKAMAEHVVDLLGCPDQTDMACRLVLSKVEYERNARIWYLGVCLPDLSSGCRRRSAPI